MSTDRVPPKLHLAVVCSYIEYDADEQPFSLVEPVFTLAVVPDQSGGLPVPDLVLYTQLDVEGAHGTFWFAVEVRLTNGRPMSARFRTTPIEITITPDADPLAPLELVFPLGELVFPEPGRYDVYVMCNHLSLNSRANAPPPNRVRVIPAEVDPSES